MYNTRYQIRKAIEEIKQNRNDKIYNTRYQIKKAFEQLKQNEHDKIDQIITHKYNTRYKMKQQEYSVNIDFDEASKAWRSNKNNIGNGCFEYK